MRSRRPLITSTCSVVASHRYHRVMGHQGDGVDDDAFVPVKFDGGRYTKKGFPLETAGELANYQRLFFEVAREVWLADNPKRERVPSGFEDALELRLTHIETGSVVPYTVTSGPDLSEFVDQARDRIRAVFEFVVDKKHLPDGLRESIRDAVKRIGASLRDDEVLYLQSATGAEVRYTKAVRTQMIANEEAGEVEREGVLPGKVVEIEPDSQTFKIELHDGRRIPARFGDPELWQTIVKFVKPSAEGDIVRFHAKYIESTSEEVLRVEDVTDVETFLDAGAPWTTRFVDLLRLRTGWYDGRGDPIALAAIEYASEVLRLTIERTAASPTVYPTPAGGVQLELLTGARHVELSISPDLDVEGYALDSKTGEDDETLLTSPAAAAEFIGRWSDV
ncbi:MAG: hypothetical protein CMH35_03780 [Microbacterium sp.]|nr:hypothetical protein [Microbacterium sp.]